MQIIKIAKKDNFTIVGNHIFNKGLSLKALGLYLKIVSLPDDWDFSLAGLEAVLEDGRTTLRSAMQELEDKGFARMERQKDGRGKFTGNAWVFYEGGIDTPLEQSPPPPDVLPPPPIKAPPVVEAPKPEAPPVVMAKPWAVQAQAYAEAQAKACEAETTILYRFQWVQNWLSFYDVPPDVVTRGIRDAHVLELFCQAVDTSIANQKAQTPRYVQSVFRNLVEGWSPKARGKPSPYKAPLKSHYDKLLEAEAVKDITTGKTYRMAEHTHRKHFGADELLFSNGDRVVANILRPIERISR